MLSLACRVSFMQGSAGPYIRGMAQHLVSQFSFKILDIGFVDLYLEKILPVWERPILSSSGLRRKKNLLRFFVFFKVQKL